MPRPPTVPFWKTAYASVVGTSHARAGAPCQDAGRCEVVTAADGQEVMLAVVCDGAGSAARSGEGSSLAVRMFLADMRCLAADDPTLAFLDRGAVLAWLDRLRREIACMAAAAACKPDDFACTLLAAVVGPARAVFVQIGDGAIVVADAEMGYFSWVFWPQHGEFANSTNFITQRNFAAALQVEVIDRQIDEVAIFSDGIERLVLDMRAKMVHAPALTPMFGWLASHGSGSGNPGPAPALEAFLRSRAVNDRTDDDKTLAMATRVRPLNRTG